MSASLAPERRIIKSQANTPNKTQSNPLPKQRATMFPKARDAPFRSLFPMRREMMDAPPIPKSMPKAIRIIYMGITTWIAPRPMGPT